MLQLNKIWIEFRSKIVHTFYLMEIWTQSGETFTVQSLYIFLDLQKVWMHIYIHIYVHIVSKVYCSFEKQTKCLFWEYGSLPKQCMSCNESVSIPFFCLATPDNFGRFSNSVDRPSGAIRNLCKNMFVISGTVYKNVYYYVQWSLLYYYYYYYINIYFIYCILSRLLW